MRVTAVVKVLLPLWLVLGLVAANCTMQSNMGADDEVQSGVPTPPACDPDGAAPCPSTFFTCVEDDVGGKTCSEGAPMPSDGDWTCRQNGTTLVCRGDSMPGDAGDWVCEQEGDEVVCRTHAYVPSADGVDGTWTCAYEEDQRICTFTPGGGDGGGGGEGGGGGGEGGGDADADVPGGGIDGCPPGVEVPGTEQCDGIDNDCDGRVDEDCDTPPPTDCMCVPGAWRYCDTPTYCRWGIQTCEDSGMEWGSCDEIAAIPAQCIAIDGWYSPRAEQCCVDQGFCCQDMWDIDHDGDTWESVGTCTDIVCT
jgi:hypothetical protein